MKTKRRYSLYKKYLPTVVFLAIVAAVVVVLLLVICGAGKKPVEESPEIITEIIITPAPVDSSDEALIEAVVNLDSDLGTQMTNDVSYSELLELSRIIEAESGPEWPDWALMAVGEVVMNRVNSEEFPDTIHDVLYQLEPVQYEPVWRNSWAEIRPEEKTVRIALDLIHGERILDDPTIVFQSLFEQGSETVITYYDADLDTTTYFCRTNNPELYKED